MPETIRAGQGPVYITVPAAPFASPDSATIIATLRGGVASDADTLAKLDAKKPDKAEAETISGDWTFTGDVNLPAGTVDLADMADLAADRLIGRDTAGAGAPEALTVGGGIEFTGSGGIQRSALTGDVTASAGSGVTTIPAGTVTLGMQADLAQNRIVGRVSSGAGIPEALTPANVVAIIDSDTIAEKNLQSALGVYTTPEVWGASTGAVAAVNQAAFDALEVVVTGQALDLKGRTYTVTTAPAKNKYWNGRWKIGSDYIELPFTPREHAFAGYSSIVKRNALNVFGPGPIWERDDGGIKTLAMIYQVHFSHNAERGYMTNVAYSYDGGVSWRNDETINQNNNQQAYAPGGIAGGLFDDGREIVMETLIDGSSDFFYYATTRDPAGSWTQREITSDFPAGSSLVWYGDKIRAAGHASGEWYQFGYGTITGVGTGIIYAKTTDNGVNWSAGLAIDYDGGSGGLVGTTEPTIAEVEDGKYIMYFRTDTVGGPLYASTSTDLESWTTPVDTGIDLGQNPVIARVEGGELSILMWPRTGSPVGGFEGGTILLRCNALATYDNGGVPLEPSFRKALLGQHESIGYMWSCESQDGPVHVYSAGETNTGGTGSTKALVKHIVCITPNQPPVPSLNILSQRPNANLLVNGDFAHWTRGASANDVASGTSFIPRWRFVGDTHDIERVEPSHTAKLHLPFRPTWGCLLDDVSGSQYYLEQRQYGIEAMRRAAGSLITMQAWAENFLADPLGFQVVFNFGSGGSTALSTDVITGSGRPLPGGLWYAMQTLSTPDIHGQTIGTLPYVAFRVVGQGDNVWGSTLYGIKAEYGDLPTPLEHQDDDAEVRKYVELLDFGANGTLGVAARFNDDLGIGALRYAEKIAAPTVAFATGYSAADFETAALSALSGLTFSGAGLVSCGFAAAATGLWGTAHAQRIKAKSTGGAVLVDAES